MSDRPNCVLGPPWSFMACLTDYYSSISTLCPPRQILVLATSYFSGPFSFHAALCPQAPAMWTFDLFLEPSKLVLVSEPLLLLPPFPGVFFSLIFTCLNPSSCLSSTFMTKRHFPWDPLQIKQVSCNQPISPFYFLGSVSWSLKYFHHLFVHLFIVCTSSRQ